MPLIADKDREHLKKAFDKLEHKVKMVMFTQETECQFCKETRSICEELAEVSDKIEAEHEVARFAEKSPQAVVTVLRTAPILGPTVHNFLTRYLARRLVPTAMGFDPLLQFLHEVDAIAAFKLAIDRDHPGIYNVVGDGVLLEI